MSTFESLGIGEDLLERLEALGFRRPTAFQEEAVPVIARGTTAVGVASAGSGKTLACALGLAERIDPGETGPQALVLRPTDDAAARTAESLHPVLEVRGITTVVIRGTDPGAAAESHVAVASAAAALAAVERSGLKLGRLGSLIIDGASAIFELGDREAVEALTSQTPRESQRVVLTAELDREVEDWVERHARRARRLILAAEVRPLHGASAEFLAATRAEWLPIATAALDQAATRGTGRTLVFCRFEDEAEALADRLEVRGFRIADEPGEEGIDVIWGEAGAVEPGDLSISWGAPPDHASLGGRVAGAGRALILLEPDELPHLQRLAAELEIQLAPVRGEPPAAASQSVRQTLELVRDAARSRDLEPYLLMLQPLLEELNPSQIAAAATALLRERRPATAAPALPAWTRLRFGIGRRDNARPGDLVGAITGEASIAGEQIGRIEIHDSHSIVEVAAEVAERVIRSMSTATIRGRPANVRVHRE